MWWSSLDVSSVTASATHALGPRRWPGGGPQELRSISLIGVTESSGRCPGNGADRGLTLVSWLGSVSQGDRSPVVHGRRAAAGGGGRVDAQVRAEHLQQPGALDAEHRVVSGPTKTSAQTTGARGRARRACDSARGRQARPVDLTSYAEPMREAHR
jgi:hypothetical protein